MQCSIDSGRSGRAQSSEPILRITLVAPSIAGNLLADYNSEIFAGRDVPGFAPVIEEATI